VRVNKDNVLRTKRLLYLFIVFSIVTLVGVLPTRANDDMTGDASEAAISDYSPILSDEFSAVPESLVILEFSHENDQYNVGYSCIEPDETDDYVAFIYNIKDNGLPHDELPNQLTIAGVKGHISGWSPIVNEYINAEDSLLDESKIYVASGYLYYKGSCSSLLEEHINLELSRKGEDDNEDDNIDYFSGLEDSENIFIPFDLMEPLGLNGPELDGDVCTTIQEPGLDPSKKFIIVYLWDGGAKGYTSSEDRIEAAKRFAYREQRFMPWLLPSDIGIYSVDTDVVYGGCENAGNGCPFGNILNQAIKTCNLNRQKNVIFAKWIHGIASIKANILGKAPLNSRALTVNLGKATLAPGSSHSSSIVTAFELSYLIPDIIRHETGHMLFSLDHVMDGVIEILRNPSCNVGVPRNTTLSICHDTEKLCKQNSKQTCEKDPKNNLWNVTMRANKNVPQKFNFMALSVNQLEMHSPANSNDQQWGSPHMYETIMPATLKRLGFTKKYKPCGDGVLSVGEDIDPGYEVKSNNSSYFSVERELIDNNGTTCLSVADGQTEALVLHSKKVLRTTNKKLGYGHITLNKNSCKLDIPCAQILQVSTFRSGPLLSGIPGRGVEPVIDCVLRDWRYKPKTVFAKPTQCDPKSPYLDKSKPKRPEITNSLLAAVAIKNSTGKPYPYYVNVFHLDNNVDRYRKDVIIPIQSSVEILDMEFIDFHKSQKNPWDYDGDRYTKKGIQKYNHPVALIITDTEGVSMYTFNTYFKHGIRTNYSVRVNTVTNFGSKIERVIASEFFEPKKEIVLNLELENNKIIEVRFQTIITNGNTIFKTKRHHMDHLRRTKATPSQDYYVGLNLDSKTLYSVGRLFMAPDRIEFLQDQNIFPKPSVYERSLKLGYTPSLYLSDIQGLRDRLGRPVFTWIDDHELPSWTKNALHLNFVTLAHDNIRYDFKYQMLVLKNSKSNYKPLQTTRYKSQFDMNGFPHAAGPLGDELFVLNPFEGHSLGRKIITVPFKSEQGVGADQRNFFDLSIMENYGSKSVVFARTQDSNQRTSATLYTTYWDPLSWHKVKTKVLDTDTFGNSTKKFTHFTVKATTAGPENFDQGKLSCTNSSLGGYLGGLKGRILNKKNGMVLSLLGGARTGFTIALDSDGPDGKYGTKDDIRVYSKKIASGETPFVGGFYSELNADGGYQDVIYLITRIYGTNSFKDYVLRYETSTGIVTRSASITNQNVQYTFGHDKPSLFLQINKSLYECNILNCNVNAFISKIDFPEIPYKQFVGPEYIVFTNLNNDTFYIYYMFSPDNGATKAPRLFTYKQKGILWAVPNGPQNYKLLYEKGGYLTWGWFSTQGGTGKLIREVSTGVPIAAKEGVRNYFKLKKSEVFAIQKLSGYVVLRSRSPIVPVACPKEVSGVYNGLNVNADVGSDTQIFATSNGGTIQEHEAQLR